MYSRTLTPTDIVPEGDWDKDGLTNEYEKETSRTDPLKRDTDKDTMGDGYEWTYSTILDPLKWNDPDADSEPGGGDGATDGEEEGPHGGVAGAETGGGGSGSGSGGGDPTTPDSNWYIVTKPDGNFLPGEASWSTMGSLDFVDVENIQGFILSEDEMLIQASNEFDAIRRSLTGTITVIEDNNAEYTFSDGSRFDVGTKKTLANDHGQNFDGDSFEGAGEEDFIVVMEDQSDGDFDDHYINVSVASICMPMQSGEEVEEFEVSINEAGAVDPNANASNYAFWHGDRTHTLEYNNLPIWDEFAQHEDLRVATEITISWSIESYVDHNGENVAVNRQFEWSRLFEGLWGTEGRDRTQIPIYFNPTLDSGGYASFAYNGTATIPLGLQDYQDRFVDSTMVTGSYLWNQAVSEGWFEGETDANGDPLDQSFGIAVVENGNGEVDVTVAPSLSQDDRILYLNAYNLWGRRAQTTKGRVALEVNYMLFDDTGNEFDSLDWKGNGEQFRSSVDGDFSDGGIPNRFRTSPGPWNSDDVYGNDGEFSARWMNSDDLDDQKLIAVCSASDFLDWDWRSGVIPGYPDADMVNPQARSGFTYSDGTDINDYFIPPTTEE